MMITTEMVLLHSIRLSGNASPCDIYKTLDKDFSYPMIMKTLKNLDNEGFMKSQKRGRKVFYCLSDRGYLASKACSILVELNDI